MTEERLRELEWAATYLKTHKRRRCRCGGSCATCREFDLQEGKLTPDAVLELVAAARPERRGPCGMRGHAHDCNCEGVAGDR